MTNTPSPFPFAKGFWRLFLLSRRKLRSSDRKRSSDAEALAGHFVEEATLSSTYSRFGKLLAMANDGQTSSTVAQARVSLRVASVQKLARKRQQAPAEMLFGCEGEEANTNCNVPLRVGRFAPVFRGLSAELWSTLVLCFYVGHLPHLS